MISNIRVEQAVRWVSLCMIALGIVVRLVAFLYNRSFFLDEAYLASSVIRRGYAGLALPLDFHQGAPLGFLWLEKTCVYLFGASEYSLRLISLLAGLASIALFYSLLKNVFEDRRPYIGTAFFALVPSLIYYSIEFKPYMLDGLITLISVYVFSLAFKHKIKTWALSLFCAGLVWISFPAVFTVAAFCLVWFGYSIWRKEKEALRAGLITGFASLISLGLLLATIYQNVNSNFFITAGYFDSIRFPLLPHTPEQFKLIYKIAAQYLSAFDKGAGVFLIAMTVMALFFSRGRKRGLFAFFLAAEIMLLLAASWLGKYPIVMRYVIFIVPLNILMAVVFVSDLWDKRRSLAVGLSLIFAMINIGSARFLIPKNVYRPGGEINFALAGMASLDKSIPLYIGPQAISQYEYKTGYPSGMKNLPPTPFELNRIIYGSIYFEYDFDVPYSYQSEIDPDRLNLNVRAIESHDRVYLLFAQQKRVHRNALIDALKESGSITEILNRYETPVYLYQKEKLRPYKLK
jgi:hypothetical protein